MPEDDNALLAAILADATNLGLGRMAAASHGVTRDKLVWTADAYIRPETYKAALVWISALIPRVGPGRFRTRLLATEKRQWINDPSLCD